MRILIATGLFPPDIGGPATYSKILLRELPKRDIAVEVLSFGSVRTAPKLIRHFSYFLKVLHAGKSADIIYAQDPVSVGFPAYFAAKILGKTFVLKVVGDYAWEQGVQRFGVKDSLDTFITAKRGSIFVRILRAIEAFVARGATRVIVPSKYLKGIVASWGVPTRKIKVIYNAFDGVGVLPEKTALRANLGLSGTIIVSVGRLVPWKGFRGLLEVMPEVVSRHADARLLIVGDGPEKAKLEALSKKLGIEKHVSFLGRLPQTVLQNYIAASDLFALNTEYEGFSHLLIEVMALNVPIVTTDVGGNGELIENRASGILIPPGDVQALSVAIEEGLENEALRQTLIEGAQRRVQDFSEERMLTELITELKTL